MIWTIRHGETEWSLSGQHTGWNDIPLTEHGREQAAALKDRLAGMQFELVLVSPLQRASDTYRLSGVAEPAIIDPDLREWNYGSYEGKTREQILEQRPGWNLWRDGVENGELLQDAAARARRVIEKAERVDGDVALFAHGHILRILTACWLGLSPDHARLFALETARLGALGYENGNRVIRRWNV